MFKFRKIKRWYKEWYFKRYGIDKKDYAKISSFGLPILDIKGHLQIDTRIHLTNTLSESTLGVNRPCKFLIYENAYLHFKGYCGMSNTVIIAAKGITIGERVIIGAGCTIMDTDCHSLEPTEWMTEEDELHAQKKEIVIGDNVFLGTQCIILKGVHIGDNSIIAAGSVVSRDVPANQIWGGNPAMYLKENSFNSSHENFHNNTHL